MQVVEQSLTGDGFGPLLTRYSDGATVQIRQGAMLLGSWREGDALCRDLFIISGWKMGLRGVTLAALAAKAPSHVSRVIAAYEREGARSLWVRPRVGARPKLSAQQKDHARALRNQGQTHRAIARHFGVSASVIHGATKGVRVAPEPAEPEPLPLAQDIDATDDAPSESAAPAQDPLPHGDAPPAQPPVDAPPPLPTEVDGDGEDALGAGVELAPDGRAHPTRYAGTTLIAAALLRLGLVSAMARASISRPRRAVYSATQAMVALSSAWASGLGSLEAMHERDARALGVVLGLERSPSVRTLWRAVAQMCAVYDPVQWWVGWMSELRAVHIPALPVYGVDGHFKPYAGDARIDKGYSTVRRMPMRGVSTVRLMDLSGFTWSDRPVWAPSNLRDHLLDTLAALREIEGEARPIVLVFDRGGFDVEVLDALDAAGGYYVTWVPACVWTPELRAIATEDGAVAEVPWEHPRLKHRSRLLVQRDGDSCVPATTNLPTWVDATTAVSLLRRGRGMEENGIKAARAFVPIDRLDDRGAVDERPDDRLVDNPERTRLQGLERAAQRAELRLRRALECAEGEARVAVQAQLDAAVAQRTTSREQRLKAAKKVTRVSLDPEARRAELDTRNRQLLLPVKNATENARRWLLWRLGEGLSPSAHAWDEDTRARTLAALIRAPGWVRRYADRVEVELELPLPPLPYARLAEALRRLDGTLQDISGRSLVVRLAPRPTKATVRSNTPAP